MQWGRNLLAAGFCLGLGLALPLAADDRPLDWVGPEQAVYGLLRDGAAQAGLDGWGPRRLSRGQALPQATARLLAKALLRSKAVDEGLKIQLQTLLPDEPLEGGGAPEAAVEDQRRALDDLTARLDAMESGLGGNNYGPRSNPGATLTFGAQYQALAAAGLARQNWTQAPVQLAAEFHGVTGAGSYRVQLGVAGDDQDRGGGAPASLRLAPDSAVSLLGSPLGVENVQLTLGFSSLLLSKFIFSAPSYPYQSPFFNSGAKVLTVHADSPNGERNTQGLYLRKQGSQGWWLFNDFQLFAAPEAEFYREFNHRHGYEAAARADLPPFGWIPLTESTLVYATYYFYGNDPSQLDTFQDNNAFYDQPLAYPESSHNLAVGWESQLDGGGTLIGELAQSGWDARRAAVYPAQADSHLADTAAYLALSKSFGRLVLAADAAQVGPVFLPGGHGRLGGLGQPSSGLALDSLLTYDPRDGSMDDSWMTVAQDPAWQVNNTQRAAVQASWLDAWGSLTLAGSSSRQIRPSGPWVMASNAFNNSPYNGYSWFQLFWANYTDYAAGAAVDPAVNRSYFAYNDASTAKATADGAPVSGPLNPGKAKWNDLEQLAWRNTTQTIWLSRGGLGDNELMSDSAKFYNSARAQLNLDLAAIFGGTRTARLLLFAELRDVAETLRPALGAQPDLLLQQVTGADLSWLFADGWQLVGTAGHEDLATDRSLYAVRQSDDSAGLGLDALMTQFADGLQVSLRVLAFRHADASFPGRDFSGWRATVGTSYVFSD